MTENFQGRLFSARGALFVACLTLVSVCSGLAATRQAFVNTFNFQLQDNMTLLDKGRSLGDGVSWSRTAMNAYPGTVVKAWGIGLIATLAVFASGVGLLWLLTRHQRDRDGHGSAAWATRDDIVNAGLLDSELTGTSLIVSGWRSSDAAATDKPEYLVHNGPESLTAFAPSGSAKTVALVIPNLLCYESSAFVLDVKGELWNATAGYRRDELGHTVLFHDPSSNDGRGARFNPLAEVNIGEDTAVKDVQMIAVYLIPTSSKQSENAHFELSARALGVAVILFELSKARVAGRGTTTIASVLSAITSVDYSIKEYLGMMVEHTDGNKHIARVIRETATEMLGRENREFSGVISSLITPLSTFRDPILANATSESDFKLLDLVEQDDCITLYLIIRPSERDRLKHYFGLFINLLFRKLTSEASQHIPYRKELLIMLEEFSSMPPLPVVQQSMDVMRGFGLKAFIILQDVESLIHLYGQNETFTSNSKVQITYTPSKPKTAKLISDMVGTTTITEVTGSKQHKLFSVVPTSEGQSENVHSRNLLTQDEVMRLGVPTLNEHNEMIEPGESLVFVRGCKPIRGIQTPYFFDDELSRRAAIDPPDKSDRISHTPDPMDTDFEIDDQTMSPPLSLTSMD